LCRLSTPNLLWSVDTAKLIRLWRSAFKIDVTSELKGVERIELYECGQCHLQFFRPGDLAGSEQLYTQLERFPWYYMWRWEHDTALQAVNGCGPLLEIGCGFGEFVARAGQRGIRAEGLELNASAVQKAQARGLSVRRQELCEAAMQKPASYDVVCSFQVLEHVVDPHEFLECCCALVKPGSRIIVCVPNALSYLSHRFDALDLPPHHMTRWSDLTMQSLADLFPLRLEQVRYEPLASYHAYHYVQAQGAARIKSRWLRRAYNALIAPGLSLAFRPERVRRNLIGHTLYASFRRI
jgi:SAM-dependent methyltransferase